MYSMIYEAICSATPHISKHNWRELAEDGWRWEKNLAVSFHQRNIDYLHDLQAALGNDAVAIGQPYSINDNAPYSHQPFMVGVYLKDVEEIVAKEASGWDTFPAEWVTDGRTEAS